MDNPYRTVSSTPVFESSRFRVREDRVAFPDDNEGPFAVVSVRSGVAVLAIDREENVYLVREWKYALGSPTIEVVCGGIEDDETAEWSAARELREEAGLVASRWTPVGVTNPMTTFISAPAHLYIATGLEQVEREPEAWEVLDVLRMPLAEAVSLVLTGGITHTSSSLLLLLAERMIRNGDLPL